MVCSDDSNDSIVKSPETINGKTNYRLSIKCRRLSRVEPRRKPNTSSYIPTHAVHICMSVSVNNARNLNSHSVVSFDGLFSSATKMCSKIDKFTVTRSSDYQRIKSELKKRWTACESIPNVFRYKLNVRKQKIVEGNFGFFAQVRISVRELI